jgi:predicted Fe-S protein YdhL (DUF1289 family)
MDEYTRQQWESMTEEQRAEIIRQTAAAFSQAMRELGETMKATSITIREFVAGIPEWPTETPTTPST